MKSPSRSSNKPLPINRRTALKWVTASIGAPTVLGACSSGQSTRNGSGNAKPRASGNDTLLGIPKSVGGRRYGGDPRIMTPEITWPLTMTSQHLAVATALSDVVLPAGKGFPSGSAVGVPSFLNEWVSSPYEQTEKGRQHCFLLFEWLERRARDDTGKGFVALALEKQQAIVDRVAWRERVTPAVAAEAEAFDTFRVLAVSAYFASREGSAWLGYVGNTPQSGEYPGPSAEALDHLEGVLGSLNLKMPKNL